MRQKQITLIMVDDIGYLRVQYHDSVIKAIVVGTEFRMKYGDKQCMCEGFYRHQEHQYQKRTHAYPEESEF